MPCFCQSDEKKRETQQTEAYRPICRHQGGVKLPKIVSKSFVTPEKVATVVARDVCDTARSSQKKQIRGPQTPKRCYQSSL